MEPAFCAHLIASWWSGNELKECSLLGHKILFWGRFGKIAEFLAALVIVIDIIGTERLNKFARDLDAAVEWSARKGGRAIDWTLRHASEVSGMVLLFAPRPRREAAVRRAYQRLLYVRDRWYLAVAACLISGIIFLLSLILLTTPLRLAPEFDLALRVAAAIVLFVPLFAYLITSLLVNALYLRVFRAALIQPAIWLLSRPDVATFARIGSVAVLIAGFGFDLLAS
jgi:hypothetical protein